MSLIRKFRFENFSRIKEDIERAWNISVSVSVANIIDIVYGPDLYSVNQKECIEHQLSQSRLFQFIFPVFVSLIKMYCFEIILVKYCCGIIGLNHCKTLMFAHKILKLY